MYYVNNMPKVEKPKSSRIQFLIIKHKLSFKDIKGHITKPKLNNLVSAERQLESKSSSYLLQSSPYLVESTLWDGIFSGLVNLLIKVLVWFLFCTSSWLISLASSGRYSFTSIACLSLTKPDGCGWQQPVCMTLPSQGPQPTPTGVGLGDQCL